MVESGPFEGRTIELGGWIQGEKTEAGLLIQDQLELISVVLFALCRDSALQGQLTSASVYKE